MFTRAEDIWELKPLAEDLEAGARYASITLPWTFNRMAYNTGSKGQQGRGLNIAKGIVAQKMLSRALSERNVVAEVQRKSHRDDDLFDFQVVINGKMSKLDLKSWNYFSNYNVSGREPFTSALIEKNAGYAGPEWRKFFPMLVPHTQIGQEKEAYCFGLASSIDFRNNVEADRDGYILTAYPYGVVQPFMSSSKLCLVREEEGKGIFLKLTWQPGFIGKSNMGISIVGEWDNQVSKTVIMLKGGKPKILGPFSCISSFQISHEEYNDWVNGTIEIGIAKNELTKQVLNSVRRNVNIIPAACMTLERNDFCNLMLPNDYTLYLIGWLTKEEFLEACKKYTGWVWPYDRVSRFNNQAWEQITDDDRKKITRAGFADCIQEKPRLVKAGWLKTTGRGGGACCYVYPNIGSNGGIKETNLYVLAQDLHTMEELCIET